MAAAGAKEREGRETTAYSSSIPYRPAESHRLIYCRASDNPQALCSMSHAIEIKLAKEIVLPVLALVRKQAAALRVGLDLNGILLTQESLADISQLLGLFGEKFEETSTIRIDANIAPLLVRACTLLRLHLRVGKLSAIDDETLQQGLNSEIEYGVDPTAVTAYLFLCTVQELALQHFDYVLTDAVSPAVRRWWSRMQTFFGKRSARTSHDNTTAQSSDDGKIWAVVVRDDPVNTTTYVTTVFRRVLELAEEAARRRMQEVHELKRSTVWEGAKQEAEARMRELRSWHLNALVELKPAVAKEAVDTSRGGRRKNTGTSRATILSRLFRRSPKPLDNVSPRAQWLLGLSRKQADRLQHAYVGVEHLVLALLELREGVAYFVLQHLKIDVDALQRTLDESLEHGTAREVLPSVPYTPNFKKVLNYGSAEAVKLSHDYLGTEHILLGVLRGDSGLASTLLKTHGLSLERARQAVREVLKLR